MTTCGTISSYRAGCKCDDCRRASAHARANSPSRRKTDHLSGHPTDWMDQAACLGMDPELFHPRRGDSTKPAKAVCATCPVQTDCLQWALKTRQRWGVWGGRSIANGRLDRGTG